MKQAISIPANRTAVLVVDLQEEHRKDRRYLVTDYDRVLANAASIIATARACGAHLFHFAYVVDPSTLNGPFHPMTDEGKSAFSNKDDPWTAICPEVVPIDGETVVEKNEASALNTAAVLGELNARGVEWVVVIGVWTEACIDATVKSAVRNGFHVLLVKDACGSGSQAMHEIGIVNLANRLYGGAVVDARTACRLLRGETADGWVAEGAVPLRYDFSDAHAIYEGL